MNQHPSHEGESISFPGVLIKVYVKVDYLAQDFQVLQQFINIGNSLKK